MSRLYTRTLVSVKTSPAIEVGATGIARCGFSELACRTRQVLLHRRVVALLRGHPFAEQLAHQARDARVPLGGPDASPVGHLFVERDRDVAKCHEVSVTRDSCRPGSRRGRARRA